jgi:hypothetical protein
LVTKNILAFTPEVFHRWISIMKRKPQAGIKSYPQAEETEEYSGVHVSCPQDDYGGKALEYEVPKVIHS